MCWLSSHDRCLDQQRASGTDSRDKVGPTFDAFLNGWRVQKEHLLIEAYTNLAEMAAGREVGKPMETRGMHVIGAVEFHSDVSPCLLPAAF